MTTNQRGGGAARKFRKKPVVIEAVQFTQAMIDAYLFDDHELPAGVRCASADFHRGNRTIRAFRAYIETLEGQMLVSVDDWIITGVKGERYACKPDIFAMIYEEVSP